MNHALALAVSLVAVAAHAGSKSAPQISVPGAGAVFTGVSASLPALPNVSIPSVPNLAVRPGLSLPQAAPVVPQAPVAPALGSLQAAIEGLNAAERSGQSPDATVRRLYAEGPAGEDAPDASIPSADVPSAPSSPSPSLPPSNPKKDKDPEAENMARAAKIPAYLGGALSVVGGGLLGYHGGPFAALVGSSLSIVGSVAGFVLGAYLGWKIGWGGSKKRLPEAIGLAIVGLIAGTIGGFIGGGALGAMAGSGGGPLGAAAVIAGLAPWGLLGGAIAGAAFDVWRNPQKYPNLRKEIAEENKSDKKD